MDIEETDVSPMEINLDTIRAATIENRIAQFMGDHHVAYDLLPYVEETNPPTIPDDLLSVPLVTLLLLHKKFTEYYGHLVAQLADCTSALKVAERTVDTMSYAMRKQLRGRGLNRDEVKEDYETTDVIIEANNKKDLAYHWVQQFTARLKKVSRELDMLNTHIDIRTQRNRNYMEGFPVTESADPSLYKSTPSATANAPYRNTPRVPRQRRPVKK